MNFITKTILIFLMIFSVTLVSNAQCPSITIPISVGSNPACENDNISFFAETIPNSTYLWTGPNGFTSTDQNPIIPNATINNSGIYTLVVTDINSNCSSTPNGNETLNLIINSVPTIDTLYAENNTPCSKYDTLRLYSNSSNNVNYLWQSPDDAWGNTYYSSNNQNPEFVNIGINNSTGYWKLTITDQNNSCTSKDSVFIEPLSNPKDNITEGLLVPELNDGTGHFLNEVCENDSGSINLNFITYDTTHLIYSWTGPNNYTANTQDLHFNSWGLEHHGIFKSVATDTVTGCYNFGDIFIRILDAPILDNELLSKYNICSDEDIIMNPMDIENTDYNYSWIGPNENVVSTNDSLGFFPFTYIDTGSYRLIVTESINSCKSYFEFVLYTTDMDSLVLDSTYYSCSGNNVFIDFSNYDSIFVDGSWSNVDLTNFAFNTSGVYEIEAMVDECRTNIEIITVDLDSNDYTVYDNSDSGLCFGDDFIFGFSSNEFYTIEWTGVNNFFSLDSDNTVYDINQDDLGVYTYSVVFTDGCSVIGNISLTDVNKICTDIPGIITPNDDGDNEYFIIDLLKFYPNNTLMIFNRWGNKIFSASPYLNDFNGVANEGILIGNGTVPNGSYFYIIDLGNGDTINGVLEIQK